MNDRRGFGCAEPVIDDNTLGQPGEGGRDRDGAVYFLARRNRYELPYGGNPNQPRYGWGRVA